MSGHGDSLARDFRPAVDRAFLDLRLDREHGGDVSAWARRAGIEAEKILDFSASINPLGPPPVARKVFQASYREISRYPDPYGAELKQALARWHELEPEEVLLGNGSTQLIYLVCTTLRPRKALIVAPAFAEYANTLTLAGAKVRFVFPVPQNSFDFSTEKFMAAWEKDDDLVVLTTPNSLTGRLIPKAEIEKIARMALIRQKFVLVDEAFIDFIEEESVKNLVRANPYLVVLRSLTKYYALPGLRLGYLLAQSGRVEQLAAYLEPWSVNGPAQKVALACLADANFRLKTERWLYRERSFLAKCLRRLKVFHPYPSTTNFLLVRIEHNSADAVELRAFLLRQNLLIRACDSLPGLGAGYFRVAVRRRKDNQRLINALKAWTV
jgi:threonine-phosphate decarboxylase